MGASQSSNKSKRYLTTAQRDLGAKGELYKTMGHIWEPRKLSFAGSYKKALPLRRENAPACYNVALRVCSGLVAKAELEQYEDVVTVASDTGGSAHEVEVSAVTPIPSNTVKATVEAMSNNEKLAHRTIRSITEGVNKSKAHLLPEDSACLYHWLPMMDLLSGHEFDANSHRHRAEMGHMMKSLAMNKLVLNGNHQSYFDSLSKGILLVIPLMSQDQSANWKLREPYKILVVCDSPDAYELFSENTEKPSADWATQKELELATTVLKENTMILADSLFQNWSHHERSNKDWRHDRLLKLKSILEREEGKVRVPEINKNSIASTKVDQWNMFDKRLRLLVVDFGKLYEGDFAAHIPDPWPLGLKAASNWSAFAYRIKTSDEILKLLPACSFDDESSTSANEIDDGLRLFQYLQAQTHINGNAAEITELPLEFTTRENDNESVSSLGAEDATALESIPVVSDDNSL